MIISKNNKQTNRKWKHIMVNKSRLQPHGMGGGGEGVGLVGILGVWGMQTVKFGKDGLGSYCTAQENVCDWFNLLYNRNW